MADKVIISNKVFESVQKPTFDEDIFEGGEILYANSFSGLGEVAMPTSFISAFNNDEGLVGKNLIIQLEQKVQQLPDGPWYVDSLDGLLHIHNLKFQGPTVAEFTYQNEPGDIIEASFETQHITKLVRKTESEGFNLDKLLGKYETYTNPYLGVDNVNEITKDLEKGIINTNQAMNLLEEYGKHRPAVFYDPSDPKNYLSSYSDNTLYSDVVDHRKLESHKYTNNNPNTYLGPQPAGVTYAEYDTIRKAAEAKAREDYKKAEDVEWVVANASYEQLKATIELSSAATREYGIDIIKEMEGEAIDSKEHVEEFIRTSGLEGLGVVIPIQPYAPDGWVEKGGLTLENHGEVLEYDQVSYGPDYYPDIDERCCIISYYGMLRNKTRPLKGKYVSYATLIRSMYGLNPRKEGYDPNSEGSFRTNRAINDQRKITIDRLLARVKIIGTPHLTTTQKITLNNVGRWSGAWYITTCNHQMDPGSGYLTILELRKNKELGGEESTYRSARTVKGKHLMTWGDKRFWVTDAELIHFAYIKKNNGTEEAAKYIAQLATNKSGGRYAPLNQDFAVMQGVYHPEDPERTNIQVKPVESTKNAPYDPKAKKEVEKFLKMNKDRRK